MDAVALVLVTIVGGLVVARVFRALRQVRSAAHLDGSKWAQLETIPRSLKLFEFRNVIVPDERGTTEIDVILVGNTGVFVVEQKEYNAWIYGSDDDDKWTARYVDGSTHQLQNPLRQNYRHVMALVAQLGLSRDKFHSLVVFSGDCELKTPMPSNVLVGDHENRVRRTDGIRLDRKSVV